MVKRKTKEVNEMAATIEIPEEMNVVVEKVIQNVSVEIGIRISKKALIPLVFRDSKEITDIVLREIKHRVEKNQLIRV